jgi:hypothetical protein
MRAYICTCVECVHTSVQLPYLITHALGIHRQHSEVARDVVLGHQGRRGQTLHLDDDLVVHVAAISPLQDVSLHLHDVAGHDELLHPILGPHQGLDVGHRTVMLVIRVNVPR